MAVDDRRPNIPKFIKDRNLMKNALTMTYRELVAYIVAELSLNPDGTTKKGFNQADIMRQVAMVIRQLEEQIAKQTEETVEKAFLYGQAHHVAGIYMGMSETEAEEIVQKAQQRVENLKKRKKQARQEKREAFLDSDGRGTPMAQYVDSPTKGTLEAIAVKKLESGNPKISRYEALKMVRKGKAQKKAYQALVSDTYGDILLATENVEMNLKKVVRESVRDISQYNLLRDRGYEEQAEQLRKKLTKQGLSKKVTEVGFKGVIDRANKKWDLQVYSNMVMRTKTAQAFRQGIVYEAEENGFDLAVISSHGAKDACGKWEGVIVSLRGKTEGYPTLDEARATNEVFHPNCEHSIHTIRNPESLHEDDRKKHSKQMQKVKGWKKRVYKRKNRKK